MIFIMFWDNLEVQNQNGCPKLASVANFAAPNWPLTPFWETKTVIFENMFLNEIDHRAWANEVSFPPNPDGMVHYENLSLKMTLKNHSYSEIQYYKRKCCTENFSVSKFNFVILHAKYYIYKCKWDESKPNYNVFIKILKTCKDTEKMIALKNNRVDKWKSKWNKIYLWLVFRRIQIWSLWWFSFYVIRHCTYTNDGLLHCFHYNVHVLYHYFYVFVRDMIL